MHDPSIIESLLLAALEKPTAEARAAYLDEACQGDADLREQVDRLLAAHPQAVEFLEQPAVQAGEKTAAYVATLEQPGSVVAGRYKLLEMIGEGGMGEVWVADQLEPLRRRVAIKLIKPGMDSRTVLGRFEAERQALALMDHPNIAKVLDAGTTADQRPYFVMELVKGTPITTFCDARTLSPRERLELFVPVCQAIQHAHTKGIIHRDIKPSNVLVALHDNRPVPKVIDFGVAKAVGQQLTEKTIYTGFGSLVGTPTYMAPEQATFNQLDIDTRADVYALGVLLYELLAGSPPVEPARMQKAALDELLRVVREEEPPRPSQRLSTSQSKASIAAVRQTDSVRLAQLMRGELDWIVMKALEKDRNRRYETANGFAADIQRYLAGEPVQAVPPSTIYQMRKFARKNRALLTTASAFVGVLLLAAIISSWLALQAMRAEELATARQKEAMRETQRADLNAATLTGALMSAEDNRRTAENSAARLQVHLDLAEVRVDPKLGLLRLCRTLRSLPTVPQVRAIKTDFLKLDLQNAEADARLKELREFATVAILSTGQDFATLFPRITHDGHAVTAVRVGPDRRTVLTFGEDSTARLWDYKTAKPIAVLRKGDERVVNCGFSTDGQTVFTDDGNGVARFWEPHDGKFRAEIEQRPNFYTASVGPPDNGFNELGVRTINHSESMLIGGDRLLTRPVAGHQRSTEPKIVDQEFVGAVELWDTTTGQFVTRIDIPGRDLERFQFRGDGRWITTFADKLAVVVLSAKDGQEVARLNHPVGESIEYLDVSPNMERFATISLRESDKVRVLRSWDTAHWTTAPVTMSLTQDPHGFELWNHDLFEMQEPFGDRGLYRIGDPKPLSVSGGWSRPDPKQGDRVFDDTGRVYDIRAWQQLNPPQSQRFHPDLARFAEDGRFVYSPIESTLIDTQTQMEVKVPFRLWESGLGYSPITYLPDIGLLKWDIGADVFLLPTPHLDLPINVLELWVQVAVCGELAADGAFLKWDEAIWEKKRQELAAQTVPIPAIPFPGLVATDRLHWLRSEFNATSNDLEMQRLARELLRRAEFAGDKSEAVRWQSWLTKNAKP